jgi:hypothetical protein
MQTYRILRQLGLIGLLVLTASCSSIQPLPNFARTGDTVSVAVRQTEQSGKFIKKEQATVTITDAAQVAYTVRLRHLFRVYSDPASAYSIRSLRKSGWTDYAPFEVYSNPYQGQWVAVVDLVDPVSGAAPPLAVGSAQLTFSSPVANMTSKLEVIPGTGTANPLHGTYSMSDYSPMETLEPMPHVQLSLSGTPASSLGGGSFTFRYVTADFGAAHTAPWVVTTSPDPNIQLISRKQDVGDGTGTIYVTVLNPHGFKPDNDTGTGLTEQMSLLRDLRFAVAWDKSLTNITDANWQGSLQLLSSEIFDLDGNPVVGLTTNVQKVR